MTDSFRAPPFSIEVERRGPTVVVAVLGELDIATTPGFRAVVNGLEPGYEKLVVDLSRCTFFASSGISILLEENARAGREGFELAIVKARPEVQRMFDLAGLDEQLTFQAPAVE
jgi:anti-anti-sigma factor